MFMDPLVEKLKFVPFFTLLLSIAGFHLAGCQHRGGDNTLAIQNSFPQAFIEPQLLPYVEEFIQLSRRAGVALPFAAPVVSIKVLSHERMMGKLRTQNNPYARAVTIIDVALNRAEIIIDSSILNSPQELRALMFHELLHAAGYDHPRVECHWRQAGCGLMGHSPYPHLKMSDLDYESLIRFSFNRKYLARLPLIAGLSHGTANLQKSH
ncbi:MAG TPA: hypothetical protein VE954_38160 [Oligoflexus sp.]|uniref:hypothetical protein n=1 Tax=Oligoflexus sp. TaxID=1971216 RepID=UPI002D27CD7A|nr:hypothetical protein [Oligoflexus sp.]HYX38964.1 hypothetical protein [Oligoflexus sp.]